MEQKVVTIIGGTGFVGRYVVKLLAAAGYTIRVIARHPEAALHLKTAGDVGQIVLMKGNIVTPNTLAGKLANSYAVINLAGIMVEKGSQRFTSVQAQGAERLAKMAKEAGVKRFIHVSALGVDKAAGSHYARSKLLGEKAVLAAFPEATILRPSVIFGPEDQFFNRFAALASLLPVLPMVGGGRSKFQPVYVGDVAKAIMVCLTRADTAKRVYELGGPHTYTMKDMLRYVLASLDRRNPLLNIPFSLAPLLAFAFELSPFRPLLTRDQVKLLKDDHIVSPNALTFATLGISPAAVEIVVPEYLARFNKKTALESGFEKIRP
jgi:uncharacterized protein YbjT (DUF2867 family)